MSDIETTISRQSTFQPSKLDGHIDLTDNTKSADDIERPRPQEEEEEEEGEEEEKEEEETEERGWRPMARWPPKRAGESGLPGLRT